MTMETIFRSSDVPTPDRFDVWRQHLAKTICPMETSSEHSGDFHGELRSLQLGPVSVVPTKVQPVTGLRTAKLIRQSDPECYTLALLLRGTLGIRHGGHEAAHGAQQMYVVDTSRPWETVAGAVTSVGMGIPKKLLPFPSNSVDRFLARSLPGREGIGGLLAQFLMRMATDTTPYRPADTTRLGTVALDLLTATLAHHLEADDQVPPESHRRALTLSIQAFIHRHLADPDLRPPTIAAAHHISTSYLHRLFQHEETTVAAWIRRQRLERARRELADPTWRTTPIHAIAARCGFPHAADFTRTFRTAYGMPPKDYRNATCPRIARAST
ncbi:helix-turn-helix domain-containing protein [Streptomyces sp. Je 1-4]|uniref:AraC-like ligand-binding domain-containing protein n=1 Tax=Streptomyces TaxID=1883 RepID=UPI0021D9E084|nr:MULTISPECIES: helix-turn-helix domain-containing protein [unclassified Streptomyces]UYB39125.1 helix-turn-helix domain-containing protein [Streptomyces sp. Je 1-4]UZQ35133.1 helix-turn-helix domain-containing protein [Streptomyces sp. Je 1-4] [Streptomyces sp. Je 1-4 4N24]UZQ42551.1 helix-turn-helix domain-containing protein [Streptomyces sp. Je 1-4] [Streptomyces sp. Je 1-4 4N24_ara]